MKLQSSVLTGNLSTIEVDLLENATDQYHAWIGPFSSTHDVVTKLKIAVNWAPACFSCPRMDHIDANFYKQLNLRWKIAQVWQFNSGEITSSL